MVFTAIPDMWWKRTDEIYDRVRLAGGVGPDGTLAPDAMERAVRTAELYAHFCAAEEIEDVRAVATSAIRDAANREDLVARMSARSELVIRVIAPEEEARYGYLAAVNSTTLTDGAVLDLGGGSLQLVGVAGRGAASLGSWPLGAVRMTERFLGDEHASKKQIKALRAHVAEIVGDAEPVLEGGRMVGLGGTIRNLAAAALRAAGLPDRGVQGFVLSSAALEELIDELARRPAAERGQVNGIKPERGDVVLAGAVTVATVMEAVGVDALEVTEAGLREGVFFETLLADSDPPLFEDVRRASVLNLAHQYHWEPEHTEHVATLSLQMFDTLATAGLHPGEREERELLWAAAMLHDVGVAVDYDDHHKHSRYLILNGGLPGFTPREVALIALMARYHRKGEPSIGEDEALMREGDQELLYRCAALLRLAEHLDRGRDQQVHATRLAGKDGVMRLELLANGDPTLARWSAERERELFEHAFGQMLVVS